MGQPADGRHVVDGIDDRPSQSGDGDVLFIEAVMLVTVCEAPALPLVIGGSREVPDPAPVR